MLYPMTSAIKAFKSMLVVLAAAAFMLLVMWLIYPKIAPRDAGVRVNEVMMEPSAAGWDEGFVELHNVGERAVSLDGWTLATDGGETGLFGSIEPGGYRVVYGEALKGGQVVLSDYSGRTRDSYTESGLGGASTGRVPDGIGQYQALSVPTPGAPNRADTLIESPTTLPEAPAPACMRDEYSSLGQGPAEAGFAGDAGEYCGVFEAAMMDAHPYVRRRIEQISDPQVRRDIAESVVDREVARRREERTLDLVVSDAEVMDSITGLIGGELASGALDGELAAMNLKFKRMLFDIILNGTATERKQLRLQFTYYLEEKGDGVTVLPQIDPEHVRLMLGRGDTTQEIIVELGI